MSRRPEKLDDFGRFAEPAVLILISLAERPRHGYAISDDIERIAWAATFALIAVTGIGAACPPALRAGGIDPAVALRYE